MREERRRSHFIRRLIVAGLCACLFVLSLGIPGEAADPKAPVVVIQTSMGNIVVELDAEKAPNTVNNFLRYVKYNFYSGTVFHRVIMGFMIQGGGLTADGEQKTTLPPVANEANNGLKNLRGTIAMARTADPHSASSQFFINTNNNASLNFKEATREGYGYTVFGKVIDGMDTVDKIEMTKTNMNDVPVDPVIIRKVFVK